MEQESRGILRAAAGVGASLGDWPSELCSGHNRATRHNEWHALTGPAVALSSASRRCKALYQRQVPASELETAVPCCRGRKTKYFPMSAAAIVTRKQGNDGPLERWHQAVSLVSPPLGGGRAHCVLWIGKDIHGGSVPVWSVTQAFAGEVLRPQQGPCAW